MDSAPPLDTRDEPSNQRHGGFARSGQAPVWNSFTAGINCASLIMSTDRTRQRVLAAACRAQGYPVRYGAPKRTPARLP